MDGVPPVHHAIASALMVAVLCPGVQWVVRQRKCEEGGVRGMKSRRRGRKEKNRKEGEDHHQPCPFSIMKSLTSLHRVN